MTGKQGICTEKPNLWFDEERRKDERCGRRREWRHVRLSDEVMGEQQITGDNTREERGGGGRRLYVKLCAQRRLCEHR